VVEPEGRPRTPRVTAVTYLVGVLIAPIVDALAHRVGVFASLLIVPGVVALVVVAELSRRGSPTYLFRPTRTPASDGWLLFGSAEILLGLGFLASLPLRPPIVRQGAGLVATLCLAGLIVAVGAATLAVEFRQRSARSTR
jgi:hypothetical protein